MKPHKENQSVAALFRAELRKVFSRRAVAAEMRRMAKLSAQKRAAQ